MEAGGDVSFASDCDFALNDGEVTVTEARHADGSDSGVELSVASSTTRGTAQETTAGPPNDTPAGPPHDTPAAPPNDTPAGPPNDTPAGPPNDTPAGPPNDTPAGTPKDSPAAGSPVDTPAGAPTDTPAGLPLDTALIARENGATGEPQGCDAAVRPKSRQPPGAPAARSRSVASPGSSNGARAPRAACARDRSSSSVHPLAAVRNQNQMTTSLTLGTSSGRESGNVRARSTARASRVTNVPADDGRWPSTVQRPTTLSKPRASSVADRARTGHGPPGSALTSSSSKTSVASVNSTNSTSTPSPTVESKFPMLQLDKFCTLPRRRRRGSDDVVGSERVTRKTKGSCMGSVTARHKGVQVEDLTTELLDRRLRVVVDMLGLDHSSPQQTHPAWMKSLEILEQRAGAIKKRDNMQRNEIGRLKSQVEQLEESEAETLELQDFLQEEKSMLAESLKESENENRAQKQIAKGLNEELERQKEECQHLVRISEQRRQEVLTLQARVTALEQRSRESLLQQGGASVALSALSSRLDDLAIQLEESSVDKALSTLNTEAEAVTTRTKEACRPLSVHLENGFQTLDNVTEPVLEEEGGGQRDSTYSENSDSSRLVNSESIQNLSAAILFRGMQEELIKNEAANLDDAPGHLVDQVLDVDSLITRLLRAISDAVHTVHTKEESSYGNGETTTTLACNGATSQKSEQKVLQKLDNIDSSKANHIPLLNGSSEVSCGESKNMSVGIKSEPVTGAA